MTAWAAGKFSGETVGTVINKCGIKDKIKHKNIIIPGYAAGISGELEEELGAGWSVPVARGKLARFENSSRVSKRRLEAKLMKLIGENLNIMSKKYGAALKAKEAKPLRSLPSSRPRPGWIMLI